MNIFSYLRSRVPVADVVSEYVALKPAGPYLKGRCPFHNERDASFTVSPHREIFYCFGCHANGDVISFIARMEQCSQIEAARLLADKFNIQIPAEFLRAAGQERELNVEERLRYFDLCRAVALWCRQQLQQSQSARAYVQSRGLTNTALNLFDIGYFPGSPAAVKQLLRAMQEHGYLAADLLQAHILHEGKTHLYSPFEDRIIFPIRDHLGRFCGFGGRVYENGDERAKYYNSQEGDYFNKGTLLFGLAQAKKSIQQQRCAFLVEGYIDCVTMVEHGHTNTVATLGTACTPAHLKALAQHADCLYVLFDADKAGVAAMVRLTALGWQTGLDMRIVQLPTGHDPASYLTGGGHLDEHVKNAQDIYRFFIAHESAPFAQLPLKSKVKTARSIIQVLAGIDDQLKQDILLQEAATSLGIPFQTIKNECRTLRTAPVARSVETDEIPAACTSELSETEQVVVALTCAHPSLIETPEIAMLNHVCGQPTRDIITALASAHTQAPDADVHTLASMLSEQQQHIMHAALIHANEQIDSSEPIGVLRDLIRRQWRTISQAIASQVRQAQDNGQPESVRALLHQLQNWKQNLIERSPQ